MLQVVIQEVVDLTVAVPVMVPVLEVMEDRETEVVVIITPACSPIQLQELPITILMVVAPVMVPVQDAVPEAEELVMEVPR
jgi:hypothetical protein